MGASNSSLSDVVKERDERSALMCVLDSNNVWQPLLGLAVGGGMVLQTSLTPPRHASASQAVVAGAASVDFEVDTETGETTLPVAMRITRLITSAHDTSTPPAAVSTKWRLRIYTHADRQADQIILDNNFLAQSARENDIDSTGLDFKDITSLAVAGKLYCRIEILGGAHSATIHVVAII